MIEIKKNLSIKLFVTTTLMLIAGFFMIVPFLWMLSTSFQTPSEVFRQWLPSRLDWSNHIRIWSGNYNFLPYYWNSIKIAVIGTVGAVFMSALAAYGFARTEFKGRDTLFMVYLSMMMIPPQVVFVPKFIMFNWLHIYNTHWALILPAMFSIFGVFMLRQFFLGIPKEITESAFMDGAGHFRIFFKLILPLAKPAIATFAIIDFSWQWNDYENALVFLTSPELYTIPLGLQNFVLENNVDYNGMMAASSAAIVPMILIFLIGQKYIIQGISSSAVKG
ncbi:carbohydrate ABC transporter permease [Paenibacillus glucanolyticus]|jgi:multiple sugar transport system permease protein|uniref:carbohydrate ABC transporter permease n=1 Tax=Paenibacillus TaxID=44249 RepID=UPI0003E27BD7|nr:MULTISPECIES: carbohydrate ABC transporter permease [Paenibacillus]AVV58280.1 carbohydrate ABC transporter permease [Paenibacillus glucanolyticus]ETT42492.1 binding-protein-dependent transport system inner membrane protein [Paenibacillus sp. FSL R5-808]MCA4752338.1 carbohydrate ABC transporter permease [Mycolicibacterium fortuitum]